MVLLYDGRFALKGRCDQGLQYPLFIRFHHPPDIGLHNPFAHTYNNGANELHIGRVLQ